MECRIILILTMTFALMVSGTALAAIENDFDGLWIGEGSFYSPESEVNCYVGALPILFIVQEGIAKNLIQAEVAQFEVSVGKKGKIKFIYQNAGTSDHGTGPTSTHIIFSGKLKGEKGKGRITFGLCTGRWTVTKQ